MADKILYFDCFSGASGDMIVGAMIDLGLDPQILERELAKLDVEGYRITAQKMTKAGFVATKFDVLTNSAGHHAQGHHGRHLHDIIKIIQSSKLSEGVKETSIRIFNRLAEAEAKIHGTTPEKVHFHEVGAIDSIIDIVGAAIGFAQLEINQVIISPLPLGRGSVHCQHGWIPVPAPATLELLSGLAVYGSDHDGETVTPTGAAILATMAESSGPMPVMQVIKVGYGAGTRDFKLPNLLRAVLGEEDNGKQRTVFGLPEETVVELEANIDDLNPEIYDYVFQRLFEEGALDVYLVPIQMKKNRPGVLIKVLCREERAEDLAGLIFGETSTIGIRIERRHRFCLPREVITVRTEYGDIRIKQAVVNGQIINRAPEYEDCKERARTSGVPLKQVYESALRINSDGRLKR